jgi:hypothetical protein
MLSFSGMAWSMMTLRAPSNSSGHGSGGSSSKSSRAAAARSSECWLHHVSVGKTGWVWHMSVNMFDSRCCGRGAALVPLPGILQLPHDHPRNWMSALSYCFWQSMPLTATCSYRSCSE